MATVNVRELARNTSKVIDEATKRKRPTIVTRAGKPVAAVFPIDSDVVEDWILANAPEFVKSMKLADEDMKRGTTFWLDARGRLMPRKPRRAAARR